MALGEKEKDRHGGKRGAVGATHTLSHTHTHYILSATGWGSEKPALFCAHFGYVDHLIWDISRLNQVYVTSDRYGYGFCPLSVS